MALASGTERAFTGKTVNGYSHDHKGKGLWLGSIGGWVLKGCRLIALLLLSILLILASFVLPNKV